MGLLHDIQAAVLGETSDLGPILLKLRLLAARLGSQPLAEWVKHESEGYPVDSPLPEYRLLPVSYTATFSGPFGAAIKNAPIPPYLIDKLAGEGWNRHKMRQSIAAVDDLLDHSKTGGELGINASNLMLLLSGKVYDGYACNAVDGKISSSALAEIRHAVRSRILELTIELEKTVLEAAMISVGKADEGSSANAALATRVSNQIIYGNVTSISATGDGAQIHVSIGKGDLEGFVNYLKQSGIAEPDARALANIVAGETSESRQEPLGAKAKKWLVDNLKKAADGTWKVGVSVATEVIKEAILRYYGLK